MTRKDFDSLVADATDKGEKLKQSNRESRGSRNGTPRKPGVKAVIDADVTAHPNSEWEDVVKRCAIVLGVPESVALADGFVDALQSCRLLPRLSKRRLAAGA